MTELKTTKEELERRMAVHFSGPTTSRSTSADVHRDALHAQTLEARIAKVLARLPAHERGMHVNSGRASSERVGATKELEEIKAILRDG